MAPGSFGFTSTIGLQGGFGFTSTIGFQQASEEARYANGKITAQGSFQMHASPTAERAPQRTSALNRLECHSRPKLKNERLQVRTTVL